MVIAFIGKRSPGVLTIRSSEARNMARTSWFAKAVGSERKKGYSFRESVRRVKADVEKHKEFLESEENPETETSEEVYEEGAVFRPRRSRRVPRPPLSMETKVTELEAEVEELRRDFYERDISEAEYTRRYRSLQRRIALAQKQIRTKVPRRTQEFISRDIRRLMDKGYTQKQAIGIAYAQARRKGYNSTIRRPRTRQGRGGERMARKYFRSRPERGYYERGDMVTYARKTPKGWTMYTFRRGARKRVKKRKK